MRVPNVCLIWSIFNWIHAECLFERLTKSNIWTRAITVIWFERRLTAYWITSTNYYDYRYHYYTIVHSLPFILIARVRVHYLFNFKVTVLHCFANIGPNVTNSIWLALVQAFPFRNCGSDHNWLPKSFCHIRMRWMWCIAFRIFARQTVNLQPPKIESNGND